MCRFCEKKTGGKIERKGTVFIIEISLHIGIHLLIYINIDWYGFPLKTNRNKKCNGITKNYRSICDDDNIVKRKKLNHANL